MGLADRPYMRKNYNDKTRPSLRLKGWNPHPSAYKKKTIKPRAWRPSRYKRKKYTKYLIIGLILVFAILAVSAYSDIPQLEPIRKQIESFKNEITISRLSVGDIGVANDIAITPIKYGIVDSYSYNYETYFWTYSFEQCNQCIEYEVIGKTEYASGAKNYHVKCLKEEKIYPPSGAKILFIYIKVENIGKVKRDFPKVGCDFSDDPSEISLYYDGVVMDAHRIQHYPGRNGKYHQFSPSYAYSCQDAPVYPGISEEGWYAFEVPVGIDLDRTTLKIFGLSWTFKGAEEMEVGGATPLPIIPRLNIPD